MTYERTAAGATTTTPAAKRKQGKRKPPKWMTLAEITTLFNHAAHRFGQMTVGQYDPIKWLCILQLSYHFGMRRGEVCKAVIADYDKQRGTIYIERLKSGIETARTYQLLPNMRKNLDQWLARREEKFGPPKPTDPIFPGRFAGKPMNPISLTKGFETLVTECGLGNRGYTFHSLRHSIATHMAESGADIGIIQAWLGHASVTSTTIYAKMTDKRLLKASDDIGKFAPKIHNVKKIPKNVEELLEQDEED